MIAPVFQGSMTAQTELSIGAAHAFIRAQTPTSDSDSDSLSAIIGISGTILGVVLGAISIWLALYFFRSATEAERRATATAESIMSTLHIIQQIHDKMYEDLFGMTKEAYADIRAKAFGVSPAQNAVNVDNAEDMAAAKIEEAKLDMQRIFDQLLSRLDSTDGQVRALASTTRPLIEKAVERGHAAAETARFAAVEAEIIKIIGSREVSAEVVMNQAVAKHPPQDIIESLRRLYAAGSITWSSPTLEADTVISMSAKA
jgi:hypothetical protein